VNRVRDYDPTAHRDGIGQAYVRSALIAPSNCCDSARLPLPFPGYNFRVPRTRVQAARLLAQGGRAASPALGAHGYAMFQSSVGRTSAAAPANSGWPAAGFGCAVRTRYRNVMTSHRTVRASVGSFR